MPEARNGNGEYPAEAPTLEIAINESLDLSAEELKIKILERLSDLVGNLRQGDDTTLMILARDRLD